MSFELKKAPFEFQNMVNDIFNHHTSFIIVYIDDVLVFSNSIVNIWTFTNMHAHDWEKWLGNIYFQTDFVSDKNKISWARYLLRNYQTNYEIFSICW